MRDFFNRAVYYGILITTWQDNKTAQRALSVQQELENWPYQLA
jgi:hypothetical protein